jgi:hypothetical protein
MIVGVAGLNGTTGQGATSQYHTPTHITQITNRSLEWYPFVHIQAQARGSSP